MIPFMGSILTAERHVRFLLSDFGIKNICHMVTYTDILFRFAGAQNVLSRNLLSLLLLLWQPKTAQLNPALNFFFFFIMFKKFLFN